MSGGLARELRRVERVEELGAELNRTGLAKTSNFRVLKYRHVHVVLARTIYYAAAKRAEATPIPNLRLARSESAGNRIRGAEGIFVEEVVQVGLNGAGHEDVCRREPRAESGSNDAGANESVNTASAGVRESEGRAGLRNDYARHAPTAHNLARDSLVVVEVRQVPQIIGHEAVSEVEIGGPIASVGIQLVVIGTPSKRERAHARNIRQRLAIGVGGADLQSVA